MDLSGGANEENRHLVADYRFTIQNDVSDEPWSMGFEKIEGGTAHPIPREGYATLFLIFVSSRCKNDVLFD